LRIGGLWYSPLLFARPGCGMRPDRGTDAARADGTHLRLSALAALVMAFNLAAFIGPKASLSFGLFAGAAAGLGWVAMSLGVIYLFEQRSLKLWLINSGYQVLSYTLMGGLLGVWK
jgi:hypothetical protein